MEKLYKYYYENYENKYKISSIIGAVFGTMGPIAVGAGIALAYSQYEIANILYIIFAVECLLGIFLAYFRDDYYNYRDKADINKAEKTKKSICPTPTHNNILNYILKQLRLIYNEYDINYSIRLLNHEANTVFQCKYEMNYFDKVFMFYIEFSNDTPIDPTSYVSHIKNWFDAKIDLFQKDIISAMKVYIFENDIETYKTLTINTPVEEVESIYKTLKLKDELNQDLKVGTVVKKGILKV